jgi:predicted dehydrogenase
MPVCFTHPPGVFVFVLQCKVGRQGVVGLRILDGNPDPTEIKEFAMKSTTRKASEPRLSVTRRSLLRIAAGTLAGEVIATSGVQRMAHAAGSDVLRVGLIGCGPRGTGAAANALNADANARLVAMSDLLAENIQASRRELTNLKGPQVMVPNERCFTGLDSYKKVLASDVDVVVIALPTFFHPHYLKASIEAGKHVFCEKTHAVDAPGVRIVIEAAELAKKKGLSIVSGLAWRYDTGVCETMKRIHDGAIGEILSIDEVCNVGSLRTRSRKPEWTEMEYQLQDWFNFFWLSCDLPGLNLVHNLDKAAWAMHDEPPVRCWGMGGRQTRVGPHFGDVWDHHSVIFEYANGAKLHAYCRQQDGCVSEISDRFYGAKGSCDLLANRIHGANAWHCKSAPCNRFDLEHVALFSAIRAGKPVNNGVYMARSSMMAIMATWACYTGDVITWEQAMASNHVVAPARLSIDAVPPTKPDKDGNYPLPKPGITRFS